MVFHVGDLAFACIEILQDRTHAIVWNFDEDFFARFDGLACGISFHDDFRPADADFKTFAAHLLDQDGDLHFAPAHHVKDFRVVGWRNAEGDVGADFFLQTVPDVAGGDVFAFGAGEWAIVDGELHGDRGGVDRLIRKGFDAFTIGDGFADLDFVEASQADDIAGMSFVDLNSGHALVVENRADLPFDLGAVATFEDDLLCHADFTANDFAESDPAEVVAIIEIGDQQLEIVTGVGAWRRDVFHDRVVERLHIDVFVFQLVFGVAIFGGAVDVWEVELFVGGFELNEQFEDLIEDLVWVGVIAVDFIDDDDGFSTGLEGFSEDEPGLCLRAFGGVDHEQHAIDHVHDAFDLAAEIGVTWGIDHVDVEVAVDEGGIFRSDGDSFFPFQVH